MPLSGELAQKSVQAAISAIEIYTSRTSRTRGGFALLMSNAWELLLKANGCLITKSLPTACTYSLRISKGTWRRNSIGAEIHCQ